MWIRNAARTEPRSNLMDRLEALLEQQSRLQAEIQALRAQMQDEDGNGPEITARHRRFAPPESRLGEGLPPGVPTEGPVLPPPPMLAAALPTMPERHAAFDPGLLQQLSPDELDKLPYGVIVVNSQGRVVHYNDTESRMVGLPRESVIGRNFFGDVAPCARVREFEGRFQELVAGRSVLGVETFEFVFHFRKGAQRVLIMISKGRQRDQWNISLIRR